MDELAQDVLAAIAQLDPAVCRRLWIYLDSVHRGRIRPGADWARQLLRKSVVNRVTRTCLFGRLHSLDDQPALIADGCMAWYRCGELHRDNGKPALVYTGMTFKYIGGEHATCGQNWYRYARSLGVNVVLWFQRGNLCAGTTGKYIDWNGMSLSRGIIPTYSGDVLDAEFMILFSATPRSSVASFRL